MAEYEISYRWKFGVNKPESLRDLIGGWLRDIATRIDGRHSLALRIETTPNISRRSEVECIQHGMNKVRWAVEDSVMAEACEALLRSHPSVDWSCARGH